MGVKRISVLGSTGSIGRQTLDIVREKKEDFEITAISCGRNIELLRKQIDEFSPRVVSVEREEDAIALKKDYPGLDVYWGEDGLFTVASLSDSHIVVNSLLGMMGLKPTMTAIKSRKDIAFANKETLVAGGELVMKAVDDYGVKLLPVDSEHSAIFQSLLGNEEKKIRRIFLTASGGPFRGYSYDNLTKVTLEEALKHPNWSMGRKITIDSATMMNKGLEMIEARWLFDVDVDRIQILIHPQSVLHSAVEYEDSSVIGQMGCPDMRVPISYALSYPERMNLEGLAEPLDLFSYKEGLTFYPPDTETFKTIELATEAGRRGGSYPVVLNAANEVLVGAFLDRRIKFIDIQNTLIEIMEKHIPSYRLTLDEIYHIDGKARERAMELVGGKI